MTARLRIPAFLIAAACLVVLAFFAPSYVFAQNSGGLVSACTGIDCQLCNLYDLFNRIIQYAILSATVFAAGLFAYAGALLFTSGGSETQVTKAKTIFRRTFIGLTIALVAFFGVETLVNSIATGKINFKSVQCVNNRIIEGKGLGFVDPAVLETGAIDTSTELGTFTGETAVIGAGPCAPDRLIEAGFKQATQMSCICGMESGSKPGAESGTDRLKNDPQKRPFSFGLFQINIVANTLTDCVTREQVRCPDAFTTMRRGETNYDVTVRNEALYRRCAEIAKDAACNIQNARRLAQEGSGSGLSHWGNKPNAAACGIPHTF